MKTAKQKSFVNIPETEYQMLMNIGNVAKNYYDQQKKTDSFGFVSVSEEEIEEIKLYFAYMEHELDKRIGHFFTLEENDNIGKLEDYLES